MTENVSLQTTNLHNTIEQYCVQSILTGTRLNPGKKFQLVESQIGRYLPYQRYDTSQNVAKVIWFETRGFYYYQIEEDEEPNTCVRLFADRPFLDYIFEKLDQFRDLTDNWDSEGAAAISASTINLAKDITKKIISYFSNLGKDINKYFDFVAPVSDGSISLRLKNRKRELNLEFNDSNRNKFYFMKVEFDNKNFQITDGHEKNENLDSLLRWLLYV